MFKKLLSNLPFNPSLISQVSFYAQRIKRESSVRKVGLVFIVLAMGVQMLAAISPAQASNTGSTNDVLWAGFSSPADAAAKCRNNTQNFRTIVEYYGLDCNILQGGVTTTVSSSDPNLDSLGRNPVQATSPRNGQPSGRYNVDIPGAGRFYMKNLSYWDSYGPITYKVLRVKNKIDGRTIWIMYDCGNIITASPFKPPAPNPPPPPPPPPVLPKVISCTNLVMNVADRSKVKLGKSVTVRGQATGQNFATSSPHVSMQYDFVDAKTNKVIATKKTDRVNFSGSTANDPNAYDFSSDKSGDYLIRLTVKYDSTKIASGSAAGNCLKRITVEKPCEDVTTTDDLELCLEFAKTAANLTQNITNANNTTAQASDEIEYTLSVKNAGKVTVPKFIIKENMNDVLEYANITNMHGGQLDEDGYLFWPATDIKPGQVIQKRITVKVKSPIPNTPVSSSDPASFDCIMTNTFGNSESVNIKLSCAVLKTVETTTTLPNTGPGEALAVGFGLTVIVAYFFARSRLFATELDIVRHDFNNGGS